MSSTDLPLGVSKFEYLKYYFFYFEINTTVNYQCVFIGCLLQPEFIMRDDFFSVILFSNQNHHCIMPGIRLN